jgi:hypothetical protein
MHEISKMSVQKEYLDLLKEESLEEAKRRRCGLCYFHALLNIEALSTNENETFIPKSDLKFLLLYKLSDAIRVYSNFLTFEVDNNSNKSIM